MTAKGHKDDKSLKHRVKRKLILALTNTGYYIILKGTSKSCIRITANECLVLQNNSMNMSSAFRTIITREVFVHAATKRFHCYTDISLVWHAATLLNAHVPAVMACELAMILYTAVAVSTLQWLERRLSSVAHSWAILEARFARAVHDKSKFRALKSNYNLHYGPCE